MARHERIAGPFDQEGVGRRLYDRNGNSGRQEMPAPCHIDQGDSFVEVAQDVRRASEPRALRVLRMRIFVY